MFTPKEVCELAFHREIESCLLHLLNQCINLRFIWAHDDGIVGVEHKHNIPTVEETFINR